jgi:uncharacterized membrane protein YfcA
MELWLIAIGAAAAGFVQGLSGFGFGLVAMSLWAWGLEPRVAAVLAVFGAFTGQVLAAATVRRGFDLPRLLPFLAGGLCGIPLGVWLLARMQPDAFRAVIGGLLVVWCPFMLFARRLPRIAHAGGRAADALAGTIGGVMGPLGGATGAVPTLWCTLRGYEKDAQRAVIQNFNLAMLSVTLALQFAAGLVTRDMLPLFAIVAPAMLLPAFLGTRLYVGISEAAFRTLVLGLLTLSGIALLVGALPNLLGR